MEAGQQYRHFMRIRDSSELLKSNLSENHSRIELLFQSLLPHSSCPSLPSLDLSPPFLPYLLSYILPPSLSLSTSLPLPLPLSTSSPPYISPSFPSLLLSYLLILHLSLSPPPLSPSFSLTSLPPSPSYPLRCGLALDGWHIPLHEDVYSTNTSISQPLYFINSYYFQWKENMKRMLPLTRPPDADGVSTCRVLTVK